MELSEKSWGCHGVYPAKVGVNQTCGVEGCYCDVLSDLLCVEPPLPKQICVKVRRDTWRQEESTQPGND